MKHLIGLFSFLTSTVQAADFCHSMKNVSFYSDLSTLKENSATIRKTDLVLTGEQKKQLNTALKSMGQNGAVSKTDLVSEIDKDADASVAALVSPVQTAIVKAEKILDADVDVKVNPGDEIKTAITAAMQAFGAQLPKPNLSLGMIEQAKEKALRVKTSTLFFEKISALVDQLLTKVAKQCASENFNFVTTMSDGKRYLFSDCLDTVVNDPEVDAFGGKISTNQCRYILECNQKEDSDKSYFKGFGFQWILDCKKEDSKCPGASICAQRVDGGGTSTIKQPNVPGGRVDQ